MLIWYKTFKVHRSEVKTIWGDIKVCILLETKSYEEIFSWLIAKKIKHLILPYETVGNKILNNYQFLNKLKELGIIYNFYIRDWDRHAFPHANKGYFKFKKNIPNLMTLVEFCKGITRTYLKYQKMLR